MPTIQFLGHILPVAIPLTIPNIPKLLWTEPSIDLQIKAEVTIETCDVTVEMELNRYDYADLSVLLIRAWNFARLPVDLYCFSRGCGYTVIIDGFVDPDGNQEFMVANQFFLKDYCTAFDGDSAKDFDSLFHIVAKEPELFQAFNDLGTALAIETVRAIMSKRAGTRSQQWEYMQSQLNVTKDYILKITDTSVGPRHGSRLPVGDEAVLLLETIKRTWVLMNRYIESKKTGDQPLSTTDFPLLSN